MDKEILVDYDVVSEFAGHTSNKKVKLVEASKDIFTKVKEKSMQLAIDGIFKAFNSIDELEKILIESISSKGNIKLYDEDIGG